MAFCTISDKGLMKLVIIFCIFEMDIKSKKIIIKIETHKMKTSPICSKYLANFNVQAFRQFFKEPLSKQVNKNKRQEGKNHLTGTGNK
jgi:hypothetical protein